MKEGDIERVDFLLKTRYYDQLSEEEKLFLQSFGLDAKGFDEYKTLLKDASDLGNPMSSSVRKDLVDEFKRKHKVSYFSFELLSSSIVGQIAMILVAFFAGYFLMPGKIELQEQLVKVEIPGPTTVDTIFVNLPADTVYRYRVETREVPVFIVKEVPMNEVQQAQEVAGTSMANQRKLREMLVSGD